MTAVAAIDSNELVRFLIARVDEDDTQLRRLHRDVARGTSPADPANGGRDTIRDVDRLRAECEAKRDVIAYAQQLLVLRDQPAEKAVRDTAMRMLLALATPYRAHSAFRTEWSGRRRRTG